ncbi:SDR family oxidoreductase [Afipia felis]|uniref:dTDP-4-dehydrorhamnose reductase n=2 Tax=Afipia felis TaxID=1035 RepID=A0A380WDN7_AFIFE|nr:SDR family oxidoreductase [Afipia felis]EKS30018.1 dTDP-4-dehydrorhamnose reductase [Afipia felis ATCC 53690]SUU78724.1 dTDP-4-dehydrorhamnose reductase [Afipia felis]SUU86789.1 dTDP-4-dehydrorhamnose reductase [Afipia felis]
MTAFLVTGATGMLGGYVSSMADARGYETIAPPRSEWDLRNPGSIAALIKKVKPAYVLHLAAKTDVDACERDPASAAQMNVTATEEIAKATAEVGGWLAYISTGCVFGGAGKPTYNELDLPCPVHYYGRSKLWGEYAVNKHLPFNHLIVRAGWMIGGGPEKDHKFVGKIISQIRNGASEIKAVDDKHGTITVARDLANFLLASANEGRRGLVHFASKGLATRFQIAAEIANALHYRGSLLPVTSDMFPLAAPRPTFEGLESVYLTGESGSNYFERWQDDLRKYVSEF